MQLLDVTCFGPLKRPWDNRLQQRINELGIKQSLTRSKFVKLCAIWGDGMKRENGSSGFESTGISVRLFY